MNITVPCMMIGIIEGDDLNRRRAVCQSIAEEVAEGREIFNVEDVKKDLIPIVMDMDNNDWGNKVVVMADADEMIPARRTASKINRLVNYLVLQSRKRNCRWVIGCKDFNRIDLGIRRNYGFMVQVR